MPPAPPWRRVALALVLAVVAAFWRLRVGWDLPLDFDEPVYGRAAVEVATCVRDGDLARCILDPSNPEHPALVKVVCGAGVLLFGEEAAWYHGVIAGRAVSILAGSAAVGLLALVDPIAAFLLAFHGLHVKYGAQASLEALPGLLALAAVLALVRSGGRPDRWFWASAACLGATAAGKYPHALVCVGLLPLLAADVRRRTLRLRHVLAFGAVAAATFLLLDPTLWPDPPGRLWRSVAYLGDYAARHAGDEADRPWTYLLGVLAWTPVREWHPGRFPVITDPVVFWLGLPGLAILAWEAVRSGEAPSDRASARLRGAVLAWTAAGAVFLVTSPSRWPHHAVMAVPPLCLAASHGLRRGIRAAGPLVRSLTRRGPT